MTRNESGSNAPRKWGSAIAPASAAQVTRARLAQPATHPGVVTAMPLRSLSARMLGG